MYYLVNTQPTVVGIQKFYIEEHIDITSVKSYVANIEVPMGFVINIIEAPDNSYVPPEDTMLKESSTIYSIGDFYIE